ncbi:MAG: RagB/SusD family nutrient uptake outer membrane protein [Bacteroidetes bacterium]|jgi:hypothetical protein|uniref:RagB/SusD family nutrient uptake outer membrane protein n=1 Tax=Candidatus Cryptobacteroides intestinavium TaxID=2840766 RepID=A0A9D9HES8_9BACT|nr:RagB/SusD family nutrient uptake outer membrane protein [Candidatus Cryptobacteroides intestinavium]
MKKYIFDIMILSASAALVLSSCAKFLEETSQDEIKPSSANDYLELIAGEIYYNTNQTPVNTYLDIMTDDCEEFAKDAFLSSDNRNEGFGYYTWQASPEHQITGTLNSDQAWAFYYHQILVANMILYDIDKMSGSDQEKAQVKAEAYMIRAFAYYMLVNLYGEPYDPEKFPDAMGVPINDLVGSENRKFKREPAARIYEQILDDGKNALVQFDAAGESSSVYRWNAAAANVFLSRICLYIHDWDGAISYADAALGINANLWDFNTKLEEEGVGDSDDNYEEYFFRKNNPEILFSYGSYSNGYFAEMACGMFPASKALLAMYIDGDLRLDDTDGAYIRYLGADFTLMSGGGRYTQYKGYSTSYTGMHGKAIRTVEAYLNRAEAYAMNGESQKALDDINMIRRNRFTPETYTVLSGLSQELTLQEVKNERRRELCFEGHRWFDLRRWDRPSITHTFTPNVETPDILETYVLEENDPAYTLPIPEEVYERDSDIENISRPVRNPK